MTNSLKSMNMAGNKGHACLLKGGNTDVETKALETQGCKGLFGTGRQTGNILLQSNTHFQIKISGISLSKSEILPVGWTALLF